MIGIYFSGTGNSKYALEVFLREYNDNPVLFSIEDKNLKDHINNHDEIVFSYPVQYSAVPKFRQYPALHCLLPVAAGENPEETGHPR